MVIVVVIRWAIAYPLRYTISTDPQAVNRRFLKEEEKKERLRITTKRSREKLAESGKELRPASYERYPATATAPEVGT